MLEGKTCPHGVALGTAVECPECLKERGTTSASGHVPPIDESFAERMRRANDQVHRALRYQVLESEISGLNAAVYVLMDSVAKGEGIADGLIRVRALIATRLREMDDLAMAILPSADELVMRAIRNARPRPGAPKWAAVRDVFAVGSTTATALCRRAGIDPDIMGASDIDQEGGCDSGN